MLAKLFSNYFINIALVSWILAQLIKAVIAFARGRGVTLSGLLGSGGMPSAHSALVCSLATGALFRCGFSSMEFAFALALALIVTYDAMGVRRAAGQHAKLLNEMSDYLKALPPQPGLPDFQGRAKKLEESLGHRPFEVLCGSLLGILVAAVGATL